MTLASGALSLAPAAVNRSASRLQIILSKPDIDRAHRR